MNRFIPVDRQTDYLLPPSVDDSLPENHPGTSKTGASAGTPPEMTGHGR